MIRVLIVDDSAFMRHVLRNSLAADPEIQVVDTARDGLDGLAKIASLQPDVVTLDLEMPRMDGFEALQRIMQEMPRPIIMLSSLTQAGADATIRALRLGAADFVPKPASGGLNIEAMKGVLLGKIKQAASIDVRKLRSRPAWPVHGPAQKRPTPASLDVECHRVVVIGTSTGGPRALHEVVPRLPANLPAGVLIVQHMPPGFTRSLAQRLDEVSQLTVKEAEVGDVLRTGMALMAPGNYHMTIDRQGRIRLDQGPQQHGVRPAVDATLESVAQAYGSGTVAAILTGMGSDGTRGAKLIKAAGGKVIAEDRSSCVIYGMPRAVVEAGAADRVATLDKMADEIVGLLAEASRPSKSATTQRQDHAGWAPQSLA